MSTQADLDSQLRRQASEMQNVQLFETRVGLDAMLHDLELRIDQREKYYSQLKSGGSEGVNGFSGDRLNALENEIMMMRSEFRVGHRRLYFITEELKAREVMGRAPANDPNTPTLKAQEEFQKKLKEDREKGHRLAVKPLPTPQLLSMSQELSSLKDHLTASQGRLRHELTRIKRIKNFNRDPDLFSDYNLITADLKGVEDKLGEVTSRYKAVNLELSLRDWSAGRS